MSFSKIASVAGAITFATQALAHGRVTGIVADGVYYEGYYPDFQYMSTQPVVVGWSIPEDLGNGFIAPDAYNSSDIICHLNATNAQTSATVKAGGTVELQWTAWPSSHHGPVLDYLANCNGNCSTVDKTSLEFFKIDGVGLINETALPGTWASDELIASNNSWTVTIPSTIAPGNYVLRHEIIALHSAGEVDGAQNYPQCVNLEVTGSGTDTPTGELGTALYSETDPGIEINIYQTLSTYEVPGPTLYSGAATATAAASSVAATTSAASSSAAAVTTAASSSSSAAAAVTSASSSSLVTTAAAVVATSATSDASVASSAIAGLSTIVPSSALTAVVPTATASSTSDVAMPAGTTLEDLLSWLAILMEDVFSTKSSVSRRHARDLAISEAKNERKFAPTGAVPSGGFAAPSGHHGKGFAAPSGHHGKGFAAPSGHHHRQGAHATGAVGPMATGGAKYVAGGF